MMDECYIIRDSKILKGKIVKPSNRGTAYWCELEGFSKHKLVTASKIFDNKADAEALLDKKLTAWLNKIKKSESDFKKIEEIVFKILAEFDYEIRFLNRPSTVEDAECLYNKLKRESLAK